MNSIMTLCDAMATSHQTTIIQIPDMYSLQIIITPDIYIYTHIETCEHQTWLATLSRACLPLLDTVNDIIGWSSSTLYNVNE